MGIVDPPSELASDSGSSYRPLVKISPGTFCFPAPNPAFRVISGAYFLPGLTFFLGLFLLMGTLDSQRGLQNEAGMSPIISGVYFFPGLISSGAYFYLEPPSILTAGRRAGFPGLILFQGLFSRGLF